MRWQGKVLTLSNPLEFMKIIVYSKTPHLHKKLYCQYIFLISCKSNIRNECYVSCIASPEYGV